MSITITRRQQEIYDFLVENLDEFTHPPTLDELCMALGLSSKGSLHKQIQALIDAGLVEPMNNLRRGIRLTEHPDQDEDSLPMLGYIAAGQPIEAINHQETIQVPESLRTNKPCYVLQIK
jgi:repressor LexA